MKTKKIEIEICIGISRCSWCCWKAFSKLNLKELFHNFQSLSVEYIFLKRILLFEIQKNYKNWVWKQKLVEPSMYSHY
jgi:hypothetical protein